LETQALKQITKTKSKGQIDKLADRIRTEGVISNDTLFSLQEYRTSHKETLSQVFNVLCSLVKQISGDVIVTYRIKRIESIISKVKRYPGMKLSRMADIGGCRCILKSDRQVYQLKLLIEKALTVKTVKDYIKQPQEEGYKSLHLFVSVPNDDKVIEVQIRNQQDHNWATLVEITDLLFDAKLKEFGENKHLLRFHLLLSRVKQLSINEKKELAAIIEEYNYLDKLSEVFARNYLQVRRQWMAIETKSNHKFFLIEAKKEDAPKISSFAKFNEAEDAYFSLYKTSNNANVVLTHLPTPNYSKISIAYSNYILTVHSFLDEFDEILENLIIESLTTKQYSQFLKFYRLYHGIILTHMKNIVDEILSANDFLQQKSGKKRNKNNRKQREWYLDITRKVNNRKQRSKALYQTLQKHKPKGLSGIIITQIIWVSNYLFRKNVKKHYEKYSGK
jgi:ppGpp synthetase/RelA/SpoT-type nucleotidyltranferase